MAEVTALNNQLGRYVLRFPNADERALAEQVAALAEAIRARADRRDQHGDPVPLIRQPPHDKRS